MATTALSVEKFSDFLPLRNHAGRAIALFSDYGSWLGVTWGANSLLEIRDTLSGEVYELNLGSSLHQAVSFPDRQEAVLMDGTQLRLGFSQSGQILIELKAGESGSGHSDYENQPQLPSPKIECKLPHRLDTRGDALWLLIGHDAAEAPMPAADLFERNRERWNGFFQRAFDGMQMEDNPLSQVLMARGVATLLWNLRAPLPDLPHHGVIPSPFYHRGYWAWDSWKHAHALAFFAPELAAEQLRAQFHRQQADGMVPDHIKPNPREDNWCNTKPPMSAWALHNLWKLNGMEDVVRELFPKCEAQLDWWRIARRVPGETLFRAGGVDYLSATWEAGWDNSYRFKNAKLVSHGSWHLFDLWLPDLNSYICNDFRAMAAMAPVVGADPTPFAEEADKLADAIQRALWNEAKGCFCDVQASTGASTGIISAASWIPVWVGIGSDFQRKRVRDKMTSASHFWTEVPFPSLSAAEAEFDPHGFWDGSVFNDHAAIAFQILGDTAGDARERMRKHLARHEAYFECYSPLDGAPVRGGRPAVPQFSWGAAAALEVLHGGPDPAPL